MAKARVASRILNNKQNTVRVERAVQVFVRNLSPSPVTFTTSGGGTGKLLPQGHIQLSYGTALIDEIFFFTFAKTGEEVSFTYVYEV